MPILAKIKNFIKPAPAKLLRERDRLKPYKGRYDDPGIFTYNNGGFTIKLKDGIHPIHWSEVEKLTAYKIDLVTFDEICINAICTVGRFTVSEDTPGWHLFVETTKAVFPGIDKDWDVKIVYPSFATNLTVIYDKYK